MLEDNARTPSGVSLHAREPRDDAAHVPRAVHQRSGSRRSATIPTPPPIAAPSALPASPRHQPVVAVLTPGIHNSAYFEHSFLADEMGVELVEGHDLRVVDGRRRDAHDPGLPADRRALPPGRRRLPRPADLPSRVDAGCARDHGRLPGRPASPWPTRPAPASPTTRPSTRYMPEIIEFYTGEKPILQERADLALLRARRSGLRARPPGRTRRQGGARLGRLRHADRPGRHQEGAGGRSPPSSRRNPATTSPSRRCRCRRCRS